MTLGKLTSDSSLQHFLTKRCNNGDHLQHSLEIYSFKFPFIASLQHKSVSQSVSRKQFETIVVISILFIQ